MISDDFRKLKMLDWLVNDLQLPVSNCEPASSDASFRRYFRITLPDSQLIVMDAPPEKENVSTFVKVAHLFKDSEIKIPRIFQENLSDGFLLLEDFGTTSFLEKLTTDSAQTLYGQALNSLFNLQTKTVFKANELPHYDKALLERELGIFTEWFIQNKCNVKLSDILWRKVCDTLIQSALEQPTTCVHRDYHSRNLMVLSDSHIGILDFQDAVIGPITYDLVSLLRDCYVAWPQVQIELWLGQYFDKLTHSNTISCDRLTFTRWFDLMGMQRHLKAIGIFSRLDIRDGKSGYLKDIPRTLNYVTSQTQKYPEFAEFSDFIRSKILSDYPYQP
jgi:aminoglycoside/choline kinase family phosphotransferase